MVDEVKKIALEFALAKTEIWAKPEDVIVLAEQYEKYLRGKPQNK